MLTKINFSYLRLGKEIILLWRAGSMPQKIKEKTGRVLIVNPCLIGDFIAGIPAIYAFIKKNEITKVDLLVARPLKSLATRISGINNVFAPDMMPENSYDYVIIMRTSPSMNRKLRKIKTKKVITSFWYLSRYFFHLFTSLILKKVPRQWRDVNFQILNLDSQKIPFTSIFPLNRKDYEKIDGFAFWNTSRKKIIFHTGVLWNMKRWKNDKWIELLKKINSLEKFDFIFAGTANDLEDYKYISSRLDFPVYKAIGLELFDLMLVMRRCDYFIGVDSGPRNLAHLADLRSITLLGPGPHIFQPLDAKDKTIDKTKGRGVWQMYFSSNNPYINKISVDEVYQTFIGLMKNNV